MSLELPISSSTCLNYRIISTGLFQPILDLSLVKRGQCTLGGTAEITIKELGRELNLLFTISGNYRIAEDNSNRIIVKLRSNPTDNYSNYGLFIEIEMAQDWTRGIANYKYLNSSDKIIRNATVSSMLFRPMDLKAHLLKPVVKLN